MSRLPTVYIQDIQSEEDEFSFIRLGNKGLEEKLSIPLHEWLKLDERQFWREKK